MTDLIDSDVGFWKMDVIQTYFDKEEGDIILGLPVRLAGCKDIIIWHYSSNEVYTIRIEYGGSYGNAHQWLAGEERNPQG